MGLQQTLDLTLQRGIFATDTLKVCTPLVCRFDLDGITENLLDGRLLAHPDTPDFAL